MAKKKVTKKLKKGGKAKGKGKKKSKKGGEKVDKELVYKEAVSQCKIWEHRVSAVELSRQEYRDHTFKLLKENESLHQALRGTEQDTIEVIAFLKRESGQKEALITELQEEKKRVKRDLRKEKEELLSQHRENILLLNEALSAKGQEIKVLQAELKQVKEFRKMRTQLLDELESSKSKLQQTEIYCRESMRKTEQKCFEEKLRMHQETTRKMAELAERAHEEAKLNLDQTTVNIFKENVRINEALSLHIQEGEMLRKKGKRLEEETVKLRLDNELDQVRLKENARVQEQQKKQISLLDYKLYSLGLELSNSESVREQNMQLAIVEKEDARKDDCVQLELLQRSVKLKNKELCQVKQAARLVLQQRSDIETFFLDALSFVRKQIVGSERSRRVNEKLPPITGNTSVVDKNSFPVDGQTDTVDIGELTWEQKEQVLRMLFAQMNGNKVFSKKQNHIRDDKVKRDNLRNLDNHSSSDITTSENSSNTFITQSDNQDISIT
ncbi:Basal body-orientation factor 1 [Oopsacas minuta]|uniref:Basal body-orientation factor 1 n=1 Tax=Oopsacas minuta TaxID=111878 RepID=A0AAV7K890_9METZ|nr:Basal body-orientation factor 1 [Oopsacas minuta]